MERMFTMSETNLNNVIQRLLMEASDYLIISQTGDTVKVGPYLIKEDDAMFAITRNDIVFDEFNSKKAAIAYAITIYNKHKTKSDTIKQYDIKIGKYRDDIMFYRRAVVNAQKHKDSFKEDVMANRLESAFTDLARAKQSLLREIKNIDFA